MIIKPLSAMVYPILIGNITVINITVIIGYAKNYGLVCHDMLNETRKQQWRKTDKPNATACRIGQKAYLKRILERKLTIDIRDYPI
jgi:hypothetical protein